MAYKIEDIDWGKMPASAIEFALEDESYFLAWYDRNNNYWDHIESRWCVLYGYDDNRERHKVSDYHPSAIANRKPTREERLDKALRALIQRHFIGNGLGWSWREGKTLEDIDPSLHAEIVDLLEVGEQK